uniref:Replication factor A C-terminal domain-containing protein n=1 Tax=Brassica oleracea var. oleracea TaxID=109376 RepID=A0A0D3CHX4_BRAOL
MASSAPAVVAPTSFDDLRLGRSAQFVVARLLRCWDSRNIKKQGEFLGITLLFLDEQVLFHLFTIKLFEKDQPFDSINFISSVLVTFFFTTSDEVLVNAPIINLQKFMLRKFEHLQALANTNLELPDVVGMIRSVQGSDLLDATVMARVVVRFVIEPNVVVYLSLWDEAAATFRGHIRSGERAQSVMVVTTVNPKIFGGSIDSSLSDAVGEDLPSLNAETVITTKELSPTGDLSKFLSNSSSQIVEVVAQKGWYYVSCTHCGKEIGNSATSHPCDQCHDTNATTVVRYKVELLVDDGENYATFLVLDKEMMKLTKQDAATLLDDEVNRRLCNRLPKCIAELEGQKFIYHLNVTTDNLTDDGPTFTVSGMSAISKQGDFNHQWKKKRKMEYGESSTSAAATYTSANEADKDGLKYSTE